MKLQKFPLLHQVLVKEVSLFVEKMEQYPEIEQEISNTELGPHLKAIISAVRCNQGLSACCEYLENQNFKLKA